MVLSHSQSRRCMPSVRQKEQLMLVGTNQGRMKFISKFDRVQTIGKPMILKGTSWLATSMLQKTLSTSPWPGWHTWSIRQGLWRNLTVSGLIPFILAIWASSCSIWRWISTKIIKTKITSYTQINDKSDVSISDFFDTTTAWMADALQGGGKVLVNCWQGASRYGFYSRIKKL